MTSQFGLMIGRVTAITASATQRARTASSRPSRLLSASAASANFRVSCWASVRPAASLRRFVISAVSANALKTLVLKLNVSDDAPCHGTGAVHAGIYHRRACVLAIEKVKGEAFDVRPAMRQMHGSGIAQLEILAFANVAGRAQADDRHPGGNGRPDPACAVFNHKTLVRAHAQSACGEQKNVRMRLSSRDHIRTENMTAEFRFQGQHRKAQLQAINRTGGGDASGDMGKTSDEICRPAHFLQIRPEPVQRSKLELAGKIGGSGRPIAASISATASSHLRPE